MQPLATGARLLREARTRAGLSQRALAERARTAQSVVARIELGVSIPSIDTLARLLAAAGFGLRAELTSTVATDPVIARYKHDIDRTLLRENLAKSVDARVRGLAALQRLAAAARKAGRAAKARA